MLQAKRNKCQPLAAAPVLIVACVNIPTSGQAGLQTGASIYPSVQNLMLAARALGLGTVLTTLHRRRKAQIHAILGIPDHIESAAIIPLGWPDRAYGPNRRQPPRPDDPRRGSCGRLLRWPVAPLRSPL